MKNKKKRNPKAKLRAKVRARAIAVDRRIAKRKHYVKYFSVSMLAIIVFLTFLSLI